MRFRTCLLVPVLASLTAACVVTPARGTRQGPPPPPHEEPAVAGPTRPAPPPRHPTQTHPQPTHTPPTHAQPPSRTPSTHAPPHTTPPSTPPVAEVPPTPEVSTNPGTPPFDTRGWTLLAEHVIDHRFTSDRFDYSQKFGQATKLVVAVLDGELVVKRFNLQMVNGQQHDAGVSHHFRERARLRSLPIPNGEILRVLWLEFDPLPVGARTRIQVWAQ